MARRDQPYLPLYVQDFMTDEKLVECSAESTGVYIRLMCIMHKAQEYGAIELKERDKQSDNQISNFAHKISRQMPYDIPVIERALAELVDEGVLTLDGDRLFQKRMVEDGIISEKRAAAGRKGGSRNRENAMGEDTASEGDENFAIAKCEANSQAKAEAKQEAKSQAKGEANTEYEIESEIEDEDANKDEKSGGESQKNGHEGPVEQRNDSKSGRYPGDFETFWKKYPRKNDKGQSYRKYKARINDGYSPEELLFAAERYAAECQRYRTETRFIKHAKTFLGDSLPFLDYLPKKEKDFPPGSMGPDTNPFAEYGGE